MSAMPYKLKFQVGARTLLSIDRRLERVPLSLADALDDTPPVLPILADDAQGYAVTSLPERWLPHVVTHGDGLKPHVRQRYTRRYADLAHGFEAYLAGFSAKSRSTLLRKCRKFAERSGGSIDIRAYCTPVEIETFHALARTVSARSYQERLMDAGLPDSREAIAAMLAAAAADAVRGWLLFLDGKPVSYLYMPADGDTLIYAYLGFDPDHGDLSPGTVLQAEAMRLLMAEGRFARLDFTEGEGQHKRLFATGGIDCVDLLLLRPTLSNEAAIGALGMFDSLMAKAKKVADRPLLRPLAKAIRR